MDGMTPVNRMAGILSRHERHGFHTMPSPSLRLVPLDFLQPGGYGAVLFAFLAP
jgi:hypothetical protein